MPYETNEFFTKEIDVKIIFNFDKSGKVISLTKVQRDEMNAKKLNKNLISPRKSANAAHADKSTDIRRLSAVQAQYIKKGYLMWLASLQELGTPV